MKLKQFTDAEMRGVEALKVNKIILTNPSEERARDFRENHDKVRPGYVLFTGLYREKNRCSSWSKDGNKEIRWLFSDKYAARRVYDYQKVDGLKPELTLFYIL